jgi:hypothetical protein
MGCLRGTLPPEINDLWWQAVLGFCAAAVSNSAFTPCVCTRSAQQLLHRDCVCGCCLLQAAAVDAISLETTPEQLSTLSTMWQLQPFTNEAAAASITSAAAATAAAGVAGAVKASSAPIGG